MLKKRCLPSSERGLHESSDLHSAPVILCGFRVERSTTASLIAELLRRKASNLGGALFFANSNFVLQCAPLSHRFAEKSGLMVVNDGIGVDVAALLTKQRPFSENLNGTDFVPALLRAGGGGFRVLLYGSQHSSLQGAAHQIRQWGNDVVGEFDGFSTHEEDLTRCLDESKPDLVLVALGNPRQERWILDHMDFYPHTQFIAVGALFDFLSGTVPRAPAWVRQCRFEWLYRLCREPRRLARRYTTDFVRFLLLCLRDGRRLS